MIMHRCKVGAAIALGALVWMSAESARGVVVNLVPDWHQPCLINPPNGPDNGANPPLGQASYRAWCVPSAAANVMGFWRDALGFVGVADGAAYVSGGTIAWTPPAPTDWQDDSADASSIPLAGGGARAAGQDLGWYLNTNDQGDQTAPGAGGGGTFSGTKRVAVQSGLLSYLTAAGYGAASVVHQACNHPAGWSAITAEIDAGRPLIGHFSHGAINPGASPEQWEWDTYPPTTDPQTGEDWGPGGGNGLGHAMTIVGYYAAGDAQNPFGGAASALDVIVAQDNRRHLAEPDNVLLQHNLPFYNTQTQQGVAPWVAYTTVNIPEPGTLLLLVLGAGMWWWRKRRMA